MQDQEDKIRQFLTDNFVFGEADAEIGRDDSLMDMGLIDSTGVLELVAFLDETFGIQISDDELVPENFDTISNMLTFLQRKGAS